MTMTLRVADPRAGSVRTPLRWIGAAVLLTALAVGVWSQRSTVVDAVGQLGRMSWVAIGSLALLAVFERWVRADIVKMLMNAPGSDRTAPLSLGAAVTVHDVGTAASKALPLGGAVGTALRWSVARRSSVTAPRFASVFVAYGVATTLVAWLFPLVFLVVDVGHGSGDRNAWMLIAGISLVMCTAIGVGGAALRSDRAERWLHVRLGALFTRVRRTWRPSSTSSAAMSPDAIRIVRIELRGWARRPWALLIRTGAAQCSGALILLISLRSLGVGAELGLVEFARVYFVAQLLGSFIPTPGGVGVVEAGMTGALVAAGVDLPLALAAVLVYRLITYVLPIAVGFVLYLRHRFEIDDRDVVTAMPTVAAVETATAVPAPPLAVAS